MNLSSGRLPTAFAPFTQDDGSSQNRAVAPHVSMSFYDEQIVNDELRGAVSVAAR